MIKRIKEIETKFKVVKDVGGDGESLAKLTTRTLENMITICETFESGFSSEVWSQNMNSTLSENELQSVMLVYSVFKETLSKLNEPEG